LGTQQHPALQQQRQVPKKTIKIAGVAMTNNKTDNKNKLIQIILM